MKTASARARRLRGHGIALALYLVLAVASFYPQSLHPGDTIAYVGDALESVYIVAWNVHQFFRAPMHLFDANILYPAPHALAFTDHRLLPSLLVAPVVWTTGNPVLAYNVALLLGCLLAAFGGRYLARLLGLDAMGAWAAGALYAFHTYQINEAPRLNIFFHGFIPLALAQLLLLLKTGRSRHAWLTGLFLVLQGCSSHYHLLYALLLLGLVALGTLCFGPRTSKVALARLLLPACATTVLLLPLTWPYLRASRDYGYARELPEGVDLRHYVSTAPTNVLYGPLGAQVRLQQKASHFVGFVSLGLVGVALLARWRRRREDEGLIPSRVWIPASALLALLLVALSLGKEVVVWGLDLGPGIYRLVYQFVPGFRLVRIPERLSLLAMLFVALLVGYALTLIRRRGLVVLAGTLAALVPLEHISTLPVTDASASDTRRRLGEVVPVGERVPQVYRWLAGQRVRVLAEAPTHGEGLVRKETIEAYFSTYHWKPIIHGYTAYPPLLGRVLRRAAGDFPSESSLQVLGRVGVDAFVVHLGRENSSELSEKLRQAVAQGRLWREARFEGERAAIYEGTADEVYRVRRIDARPAAPMPTGQRLREADWRYAAKVEDPLPAADGDLATAWRVPRQLNGDEYFEVTFGRPIAVSGIVLRLRRDSVFPTVFRVVGRKPDGRWIECARLDDAHLLQLVDQLRRSSRDAVLGFDLCDRELTAVRLLVAEGAESFDGWSLPEVEVWVK